MKPRLRRKPSWLRLLVVLLIVAVGYLGVFGGKQFGDQWNDLRYRFALNGFLHHCAPDQMRFCVFMGPPYGQSFQVTVNLQTGAVARSGGDYRQKWGLFWQPEVMAVFSYITLPVPDAYTPDQVARIKTCLQSSYLVSDEPIRFEYSRADQYLAFHRESKLIVCQEGGDTPSSAFNNLYKVLFVETALPSKRPDTPPR